MPRIAKIPGMEDFQDKDPLEKAIQIQVEDKLRVMDWFVQRLHGSMYQSGVPDIYAHHIRYGGRWIEIKKPTGYKFTAAQYEKFPRMASHGVSIHICTSVEQIPALLFQPANWYMYLPLMGLR